MSKDRYILCPYCGHTQQRSTRCVACGGLFEPLSRKATEIAMGPWFIRDQSNPHKPGCSYDVLRKMAASQRLTATTVLRGPTTRQFWSVARHVPGVAHLLGFCHGCGTKVPTDATACPSCEVSFAFDIPRNELGLQYANETEAASAQQSLDKKLHTKPPPSKMSREISPPQEVFPEGFSPPDVAQTGPLPGAGAQREPISAVIWLLLGLNAITAAVAGVLLWLNLTIR